MFRIALSSVTTVKITSDSAVTFRQVLSGGAAKLSGKRRSGRAIRVVNSRDVKLSIPQSARHVRAHATDPNKTNVHNDEVTLRRKTGCAFSLRLPWSLARVLGK